MNKINFELQESVQNPNNPYIINITMAAPAFSLAGNLNIITGKMKGWATYPTKYKTSEIKSLAEEFLMEHINEL